MLIDPMETINYAKDKNAFQKKWTPRRCETNDAAIHTARIEPMRGGGTHNASDSQRLRPAVRQTRESCDSDEGLLADLHMQGMS